MGASKQLKQAFLEKGIKPGAVADMIGMESQAFYNKLSRDSWKYSDVQKLCDKIGFDVVLVDRESGVKIV